MLLLAFHSEAAWRMCPGCRLRAPPFSPVCSTPQEISFSLRCSGSCFLHWLGAFCLPVTPGDAWAFRCHQKPYVPGTGPLTSDGNHTRPRASAWQGHLFCGRNRYLLEMGGRWGEREGRHVGLLIRSQSLQEIPEKM